MLGQKPSKEIATIAEGFIFIPAAVGGGRSDCTAGECVCRMLLIWPLPYRVSRISYFPFIQTRSAWRYKPYTLSLSKFFQVNLDEWNDNPDGTQESL